MPYFQNFLGLFLYIAGNCEFVKYDKPLTPIFGRLQLEINALYFVKIAIAF